MKKSLFLLAAFAAIGIVAVGCASKEKQLVGVWKIDGTKLPAALTTGPMAAESKKMVDGVSIELKDDHSMAMTSPGQQQQGTWKLEGSTVTLTPTGGKGDNTPATGTLSDDGKSIALNIPNVKDPLTLVKSGS